MPSLVLLIAAAHYLRATDLDVTPLAGSVLVSVPAVVLLARDSLREVPESARSWLRMRLLIAYGGLLMLGALAWIALAVGTIFYVPAGPSDRTNSGLTIVVAALANIAYPLLALGSVCGAARTGRPERPPLPLRTDPHGPS